MLLAAHGDAHAEELRAHGTLGLAHAVASPQSVEFGFGAHGSASLELPLSRGVGIEGKLTGLVLSQGDAPSDPRFAPRSTGTSTMLGGGVRFRPFTEVAGPWFSAGIGGAQTGDRTRFALDGAIGYDVRTGNGRLDVGPYLGFVDIVQVGGLRPNDAYVVSIGLHVGFGTSAKAVRPDRDGDGIFDEEDACPDAKGVRTEDPKTNGCPPDRDKDGIIDELDACPDVPGAPTDDPETNGCPPDRDKDGVIDVVDACPDVPGPKSDDPKINGCPYSDRDQDGIIDGEDACPDVPGVRTLDPKTNGCPPASESVRVEKDKILFEEAIIFDLDSPRVRTASHGIVKKLADFIVATPSIVEVSIEGHADATGSVQHNLVLSRQRAENVKALLVKNGVDANRLKAEAFGRSRLKVQTDRAEAKNRRVEFWITRVRPGEANTGKPNTATPQAVPSVPEKPQEKPAEKP